MIIDFYDTIGPFFLPYKISRTFINNRSRSVILKLAESLEFIPRHYVKKGKYLNCKSSLVSINVIISNS